MNSLGCKVTGIFNFFLVSWSNGINCYFQLPSHEEQGFEDQAMQMFVEIEQFRVIPAKNPSKKRSKPGVRESRHLHSSVNYEKRGLWISGGCLMSFKLVP